MSKRMAQLFDRAADHLEEYGWMRDDFFPEAGDTPYMTRDDYFARMKKGARRKPCCALGVMYAQAKSQDEFNQMANFFQTNVLSDRYGDIPEWNDKTSRRKAQVVAAFRRAAKVARGE